MCEEILLGAVAIIQCLATHKSVPEERLSPDVFKLPGKDNPTKSVLEAELLALLGGSKSYRAEPQQSIILHFMILRRIETWELQRRLGCSWMRLC